MRLTRFSSLFRFSSQFLVTLLLCLIPLIGQTGGHGGGEGDAATYPGYVPLEPALVVNLANPRRAQYLRIDAQFYVETSHDADLVKQHMPAIRDRLIGLLGGREPDRLMSPADREQLRNEMLETLRHMMSERAKVPAISALYFTGFIVQ